jgi:hypothetical protein
MNTPHIYKPGGVQILNGANNPGGVETAPALYDGSPWPAPLKPAAFHGLAGEIVRRIEPHTESDPAALLAQFLLAFGNSARRAAHWLAEDTPHFTNEFAVIVGQSSVARKGTSLDRILALFEGADLDWRKNLVSSGLVSGEGVVHAIRDAKRNELGVIEDEGARDKRLFVTESEFASVLSVFARKENTLSAILRNAWDSKTLRTLAKNVGEVASEPHVSIVAHITFDELKSKLAKDDLSNGVANRFLWICAQRSKQLPLGGTLRAADCQDLITQLSARLKLAKTRGLVGFTSAAENLWCSIYAGLNQERPGTLGNVTSRAPAHARRLALIYALLDGADVVDTPHLQAALAFWQYCHASAECIFGGLSALARDIHERLRLEFPGELHRTDLHDATGRNKPANEITRALAEIQRYGLATSRKEQTGGAPRELWRAATK